MKFLLKGIKFIAVLVLLINLLVPLQTVSASSLEKTALPSEMEKDYKEMMSVIRENVVNEESKETIANLPEVKKFKEKYTEDQINSYLNNKVKDFKNFKNSKLLYGKKVEIGANDKKIIDYPDGSFVVLKSTTKPSNDNNNNLITPMASYNGSPGSSWTTTYEEEFWGIYLAARAVLVTKYKVNRNSINIYDTDDAGSKAIFPTTLTLRGTEPVINDAKTVESKGSYQKVNGIVIGGQPVGSSDAFTLRTKISITASTSSKVYFSVTNSFDG